MKIALQSRMRLEGLTAFACNQRDEARELHDVSAAICASQTMKQQTFIAKGAYTDDVAATIFAGYGNHWNGNAGA